MGGNKSGVWLAALLSPSPALYLFIIKYSRMVSITVASSEPDNTIMIQLDNINRQNLNPINHYKNMEIEIAKSANNIHEHELRLASDY